MVENGCNWSRLHGLWEEEEDVGSLDTAVVSQRGHRRHVWILIVNDIRLMLRSNL